MKYLRSGITGQLIAGALCLFLSFISKETVISFMAIIPLVFFFYRNDDRKKCIDHCRLRADGADISRN
jgi:hypothetical protein